MFSEETMKKFLSIRRFLNWLTVGFTAFAAARKPSVRRGLLVVSTTIAAVADHLSDEKPESSE